MQHGKPGGKSALWAVLGLAAFCACAEQTGQGEVPAEGSGLAEECAGVEAPEPVSVDAEVSVVATGLVHVGSLSTQLSPHFISDGSGIYWHDTYGSVFAHHPGEAGAVALLQQRTEPYDGVERELLILGIAASADQIYVTNGYMPANTSDQLGISDLRGPSRLLAVPKQGGPASLVLETEDTTLWPLTVEGDRLIVVAYGAGGSSYHQVNLAASEQRLEPLPVKGSYHEPRLAGDSLVWFMGDGLVLTSGFDDAEPRQVARLTGDDFWVGPGYVMARRPGSERTFIDTVDLQDGRSRSCTQVPSSAPLSFFDAFAAPLHIYYFTLRNWVPENDNDRADHLWAHTELAQLELATGALTLMNLPGISVQPYITIVGQDAESLYVRNGDALLAVRKPLNP